MTDKGQDSEGNHPRVTVEFNATDWLRLSEGLKPIAEAASLVALSPEVKSSLERLSETVALNQQASAARLAVTLGVAVQAQNEWIAANFAKSFAPLSEQIARMAASLTAPYAAVMQQTTALDWARISAQSVPVIPNSLMARVARSVVTLPDSQVVAPAEVAQRLDLSGIDRTMVQHHIVLAIVYVVCVAYLVTQMVENQALTKIAFDMVQAVVLLREIDKFMQSDDENGG